MIGQSLLDIHFINKIFLLKIFLTLTTIVDFLTLKNNIDFLTNHDIMKENQNIKDGSDW